MRDYESNDLEGAGRLAAMEEDFHRELPSPSEYRDLSPIRSKPELMALGRSRQKLLKGTT